ncbi:MAG: ankyrin repeat domain-containing protein [Rickettsiales bacterium]|nr:ankyrin repeat domain-containing protein [Rickettsiales bacterium]MDR1260853.1 ankyrin repeat domain-containing protein [Rickettsiales bacterium]
MFTNHNCSEEITALNKFLCHHKGYNQKRERTSTEKKVLELQEEWARENPHINYTRTKNFNYKTACAHGTNGWAIYLACTLAKGQLLPGNGIKLTGIFANSGESGGTATRSRNFVSAVCIDKHRSPLDITRKYTKVNMLGYEELKDRLVKKYKERGDFSEEALTNVFNDNMKNAYERLSNMEIIAIGDGIGGIDRCYTDVRGPGFDQDEVTYECVNIRVIIVKKEHKDFIQGLIHLVDPDLTKTIAFLTAEEVERFEQGRKKSKDSKEYVSTFCDDFFDSFREKLPFSLSSCSKKVLVYKHYLYKIAYLRQGKILHQEKILPSCITEYYTEDSENDPEEVQSLTAKFSEVAEQFSSLIQNLDEGHFYAYAKSKYKKARSSHNEALKALESYTGDKRGLIYTSEAINKIYTSAKNKIAEKSESIHNAIEDKALLDIREMFSDECVKVSSAAHEVLSGSEKRGEHDRKEDANSQTGWRSRLFKEEMHMWEKIFQDLRDSIKSGNLEKCNSSISTIRTLNASDKFSVLFDPFVKLAIEHDNEKILGLLTEKGAKISPNDALNDAAEHGSKKILDYLLSKYADKVDIDHQDGEKNTALHHALQGFINAEYNPAKQGKYKNFVESLLRAGTKLDVKNNKNETPLDLLIDYIEKYSSKGAERLSFVLELLSKHGNKNVLKELKYKSDAPALNKLSELAVEYNSQEGFKSLLDQFGTDINYQGEGGNTALHYALRKFCMNESKYKGFVETFLSKSARLDVKNDQGETPFDLLIDYIEEYHSQGAERLDSVLKLLDKHGNKNVLKELKYKGDTPALNKLMELAVKHDHEGILDLLVKNNTQVLNTTLSDAVEHGSKRIFDCLLNKYAGKVDIDYQGKNGNTALHQALIENWFNSSQQDKCKSFAESLLSKGARLDVKNDQGKTPFDLLIDYVEEGTHNKVQRLTFVSELLNNCKEVLKEPSGTPALNKLMELAVKHDHEGILDLLVKNNTQILNTTLGGAVKHGSKKIFDCLLNKHANKVDIDYQDGEKNTALHYALQGFINTAHDLSKQYERKRFVESLLGKGAKLDVKNDQGKTPFDLLIDYVEKESFEKAGRLNSVVKLLSNCKDKNTLQGLKHKDGTPALDKLKKLESDFDRSYSTCENSKVPEKNLLPGSTFNNSLRYVVGAIAGAAIGAALAYSITDAFSVIITVVVIGSLLGMAITYGVSKCLEQPKVEQYTKGPQL